MSDWLGESEGDVECHSVHHDFLAASGPSDSDTPFCLMVLKDIEQGQWILGWSSDLLCENEG